MYTFREWEADEDGKSEVSEVSEIGTSKTLNSSISEDYDAGKLKSQEKNKRKLQVMIVFTTIIMLSEIIVGYITNSLALISDSFHMLSDVISLIVAVFAIKLSKRKKSIRMTYGWVRAEILGGYTNAVFLIALCVNIIIEAVQRFFNQITIVQPFLLVVVASIGLTFNLMALFIFSDTHGHSHSHGTKKEEPKGSHQHKEKSTLMTSVFLHVLGDALGSLAVISSSLLIWLTTFSWRFYIDPIISFILSFILLFNSLRLVKATGYIILQRVPADTNLSEIENRISQLKGIIGIHEMHVWQLDDKKNICSLHIACESSQEFNDLSIQIRNIIHEYGIHNITIQPEFFNSGVSSTDLACISRCTEVNCKSKVCC